MSTKALPPSSILHHLSSFILLLLALFSASPRAPAQGVWGDALSFNGTSNYVAMPPGIWFSNQFTIEAWVYERAYASYMRVLDFGNAQCSDSVILCQNGGTGEPALIVFYGGSSSQVAAGPQPLPLNQWVHLAATLSNTTAILYVNGSPVATNSAMPPPNRVNRTNNYVAKSNWAGDPAVNAIIDDVRIWDVALSWTNIQANMGHPLTGTETNLVGYWKFDEAAGIMAYDATTNHNNGTLINRPLRVPSDWWPVVTLNSPDVLTNECHMPFVDSTTVNAAPTAIAAVEQEGFALKADGTLIGWYYNYDNYGDIEITNIPCPAGATNLVAIAVNGDYSLALKADGTVIAWGSSSYGQTNPPASATNVVAIAAGDSSCLALKANGTVIAWGDNSFGNTNIPARATNVVAIAAGSYHSLALQANGTVIAWGGGGYSYITNVPAGATNVVAIAAGNAYSLALKADGTVIGWGDSYYGQTNAPASATNVVAIAAGDYSCLALKADGTVVGWGDTADEGAIPAGATNVVAIAEGYGLSLVLQADGTVIGWTPAGGGPDYIEAPIPPGICQVNLPLSVSGGLNANAVGTCTVTYNVTNALGNTGTGTRTVVVDDTLPPVVTLIGNNPVALAVGASFVDPGATAMDLCMGNLTGSIISNLTVNTSVPGVYTNTFTVTDASGNVGTAARIVRVGAPLVTTLPPSNLINDTATFNGTVNPNGFDAVAWFEWHSVYETNFSSSTAPQSVGGGTNTVPFNVAVSGLPPGIDYHYRLVASNSVLVVRGGDQVFWTPAVELNTPALLTLELGTPFVDPTAPGAMPLAVAAESSASALLRTDGTVIFWGSGVEPDWPAGLPTGPVVASNAVAIAENMVVEADGTVVIWQSGPGSTTPGPPSATNVVAVAAGQFGSYLALKADGTVIGWGDDIWGETTIPTNATNVVAIAAGSGHSLALQANGAVIGWGDDSSGEIDIPAGATNVVAIAAAAWFSLAVEADGTVLGWGDDSDGEIDIPAGATNVVAVAAGGMHSLALKADGTVLAWGDDTYGANSIPASVTNVVAIADGGDHCLVLEADGTVVGWGDNGWYESTNPANADQCDLVLGVSGTVNSNVLGTYVLTYSVTNALGAIGTAARTVVMALPPVVTTEPATGLEASQATLQGTANANAAETMGWFEYGLGANYTNETPQVPVGDATNAQPFNLPVPGLLPWMTYHYRALASNALGQAAGADATFTLPGPSKAALSLSALSNLTLPQGGSTSVPLAASPPGLDIQVRSSNPVLLPASGLVLAPGSLGVTPDPDYSGSAQVTVTATDGSSTVSSTFNVTVTPSSASYCSPLLWLTNAQVVSRYAWRFSVVDTGTGYTNYAVEYATNLASTNAWMPATNVAAMPGGIFEVTSGPPQPGLGFYRVKGAGFQLLTVGFGSGAVTAEQGFGPAGAVLVFSGVYTGAVTCVWTDQTGTTWTNTVTVNGNTAVLPVPASYLTNNGTIGQMQYLTMQLQAGAALALGATTQSTVTIDQYNAEWQGVLQAAGGTLDFGLTIIQTNGRLYGHIQSDGFGFFPTNTLVQLNFTQNAFTAVATNIALPMLTACPSLSFTNYLDLRFDATNSTPGVTNVTPTSIQGVATLVSKTPGYSYLDSGVSGTFTLLKPPTAPSTNQLPLTPVP
jgi:alpha-tubulin suppressor-like RCC1 family protein